MKIIKSHLRQVLDRSASTFTAAAFLPDEVARRLSESFNEVSIQPIRILDLGAKTGYSTELLQKQFPASEITSVEISETMLKQGVFQQGQVRVAADPEQLPFLDQSFDLIFSNLTLQWFEFEKFFFEVRRILRPKGLFLFSTFGVDTLIELRQAWSKIDDHIHTLEFIDMHHLGDALLRLNFIEPVVYQENIKISYDHIDALLANLKQIGYTNLNNKRIKYCLGKNHFQKFKNAYQKMYADPSQVTCSFEIIYGQAWKNEILATVTEIAIALENIQWRQKK